MLKKTLIVILFLVFAIGAGLVGGKIIKNNKEKKSDVAPPVSFHWGVFTNPYAFNIPSESYNPANVDKQIADLKDLGVTTVRFNYEFSPLEPEVIRPENDYFVNKLIENNIIPYMVIENRYTGEEFFKNSSEESAYAWGKFIAEHFKGRVKYYQLLNEVSGTAIKKDFPGNNYSDYDEYKYQAVKKFVTGLSKAIHDVDPSAKRAINFHWVATAIIDRLIADKVDFEIIGCDWFSDMGDNITAVKFDPKTVINIPKHFAATGKEFWIAELNRQGGSYNQKEDEQAQFLKSFISSAQTEPNVRGIFVYKLFDTTSLTDGKHTDLSDWGIVGNAKKGGLWGPGEKKPAYLVFKDFITRSLAGR